MFDIIIELIEENLALFCILGVIIFIVCFFLVRKYFRSIEAKTGYNPVDKINLILCGSTVIAPFIGAAIQQKEGTSILVIVLFLIPVISLVVRNLKIQSPLHIVLVSIIQVVLGFIIALGVALVASLFLLFAMLGAEPSKNSNGRKSRRDDDYISPAAQSWMGKEYDVNRANELGFNTVEEAIESGFTYDGRRV